ncbi:hypothetical protein [Arthrobacter sp.]|uniref:hypothetical protein n=1 Tax=Arthrobacter sp. TaxID=1667 RepID=UPI002812367E|nr:hypothetical protein [Arthrobacter sp.]
MSDNTAAYYSHFKSREPELEGWRVRAGRQEYPQEGSELHQDDAVFEAHPISEAARICLVSAGEHLRLAWTAIKAREVYPIAHYTTLRGALLAGSQAVHILGPDDAEIRRGRGLVAIAESYKRSRQFHEETLKSPGLTGDEQRRVRAQMEWLTGRMEEARRAGGDESLNVSDAVIPYAAEVTYRTNADLQNEVNLLWRQMSGDAHALTWALAQRAVFQSPVKGQLLSTGVAGGSLEEIAQPFEASFQILKRGWALYDRRCETP